MLSACLLELVISAYLKKISKVFVTVSSAVHICRKDTSILLSEQSPFMARCGVIILLWYP